MVLMLVSNELTGLQKQEIFSYAESKYSSLPYI